MPSAKNTGDSKVGRSEEEILDILMFKFDEQIISHLDKRAKEAILKQEKIKEERVFAKVKGAIEGRILDLLLESLTSAPKLPQRSNNTRSRYYSQKIHIKRIRWRARH
jgi:hypothetical protein